MVEDGLFILLGTLSTTRVTSSIPQQDGCFTEVRLSLDPTELPANKERKKWYETQVRHVRSLVRRAESSVSAC